MTARARVVLGLLVALPLAAADLQSCANVAEAKRLLEASHPSRTSCQHVWIPTGRLSVTTPARLTVTPHGSIVAIADGPTPRIFDPRHGKVDAPLASELVRRYNAHAELVEACRANMDAGERLYDLAKARAGDINLVYALRAFNKARRALASAEGGAL